MRPILGLITMPIVINVEPVFLLMADGFGEIEFFYRLKDSFLAKYQSGEQCNYFSITHCLIYRTVKKYTYF